jgi:hypothetical protein
MYEEGKTTVHIVKEELHIMKDKLPVHNIYSNLYITKANIYLYFDKILIVYGIYSLIMLFDHKNRYTTKEPT